MPIELVNKKEKQKFKKHIQECVEHEIRMNVPRELLPYLNKPIIKVQAFDTYNQSSSPLSQLYWSVANNRSGRFFVWSTILNQWVDLGGPIGKENPKILKDKDGSIIESFDYEFSPYNVFSTKDEFFENSQNLNKEYAYLIGSKNRVIDFLRLNLYSHFSVGFNNGPEQYLPGISRIALSELGFYSFNPRLCRGGDISKLAKFMNLLNSNKEIMSQGIDIDENLNGMTFKELVKFMSIGYKKFKKIEDEKLSNLSAAINNGHTYKVITIDDKPSSAGFVPTTEGLNVLRKLSKYVDWCICTDISEYAQYTGNGGKFFILLRDDYKNITKPENKNDDSLDDYGLSMISVLVGTDGYPDIITTRWNHNYSGENNKDLWTASQLQNITNINYKATFYPRTKDELRNANLNESKNNKVTKVNSGIMDAITGCGAIEESDKEGNYINNELQKLMSSIANFMYEHGLNIKPFPKIELDWKDQNGILIQTGYYSPEDKRIVVFCNNRHIKDILRSFAHEMIHHEQNLNGKNLNFSSNIDLADNDELEKIEGDAFLRGNLYFRKWTEEKKRKKQLNEDKKTRETIKNDKGEIVPEKCTDCGGSVCVVIRGEPIYVCSKCNKYFGTMPFNLKLNEEIEEFLEPEDVDLSSFSIKQHLNPKFWKDNRLDSRIRMKLLDIADDFIDFLNVDWVRPNDIILTGSLANYNWHQNYSDVDIHIIYDFSKIDDNIEFVDDYFYSKKKLWNEEHANLKIFDFPVEMFVEDINNQSCSSGVYSLESDEWKKTPNRKKLAVQKVNKNEIKKAVSFFTKKIDKLCDMYEKSKDDSYKTEKINHLAEKLFDKIKKIRRQSLSNGKGEISNGNIVFKTLRRNNYIGKLTELILNTYNNFNSIN